MQTNNKLKPCVRCGINARCVNPNGKRSTMCAGCKGKPNNQNPYCSSCKINPRHKTPSGRTTSKCNECHKIEKRASREMDTDQCKRQIVLDMCQACFSTEDLVRDHDHSVSPAKIKMILCNSCNKAKGMCNDSAMEMIRRGLRMLELERFSHVGANSRIFELD